jgi:glycosyltransferase involved in cell wall biosynthesis
MTTWEPQLISVIIPCYNQAQFLAEAMQSVLSQTYPHFEIIVVDDGSTDNTSEIVGLYPGARCIRQEHQGLSAARNTGLRESNGSYLVFLDADDRLLPDALAAGLDCLKAHPECGFVYGHYRRIAYDGSPLPTIHATCIERDHYLELLREDYIVQCATVMYRRMVFESSIGFDSSVKACVDHDLFLRVARNFAISCHGAVVSEYRQHKASMSRNSELMLKWVLAVLGSQRRYVKGNQQYEEALKCGLRWGRAFYGEQLANEVRAHILEGKWRQASRGVVALLRYYRRGFVKLVSPKLHRAVLRIMNAASKRSVYIRRRILRSSTGSIVANPNPISVCDGSGVGLTTLSWTSKGTEAVEVRIGAPNGPLFSRTGPSGGGATGKWVREGMVFYLQEVTGGAPLTSVGTLCSVTVGLELQRTCSQPQNCVSGL